MGRAQLVLCRQMELVTDSARQSTLVPPFAFLNGVLGCSYRVAIVTVDVPCTLYQYIVRLTSDKSLPCFVKGRKTQAFFMLPK